MTEKIYETFAKIFGAKRPDLKKTEEKVMDYYRKRIKNENQKNSDQDHRKETK